MCYFRNLRELISQDNNGKDEVRYVPYMGSHGERRKRITILALTLSKSINASLINVYADCQPNWPEGC
jgi:hypothetical protein